MSTTVRTRRPAHPRGGSSVRASVLALALVLGAAGCGQGDENGPASSPASRDDSSALLGGESRSEDEDQDQGLPQGVPPKVDHVVGTVLHRPDGTTLELQLGPEWGVTAVTRAGGGDLFVTDGRWFEGTVGQHRLRPDGSRRGTWHSTGAVVEASDGAVAWVEVGAPESGGSGRARVHVSGRSQRLVDQHLPRVLGYLDGEVVHTARVLGSGNRWTEQQFVTELISPPKRVRTDPVRVTSPGGTSWYEVTEARLTVSLGGRVETFSREKVGADSPPVWEDETHLLVQHVDGEQATIARIRPDGELERTLGWTGATSQEWAVPVG